MEFAMVPPPLQRLSICEGVGALTVKVVLEVAPRILAAISIYIDPITVFQIIFKVTDIN